MKTVAIIGCGKRGTGQQGWAIGHAHANGYQHCGEAIKIHGVDLAADNLMAFGEKFGLPEEQLFCSTDALYAALTPDVVSICTWPGLHAPMAIEAMEKGVKALIIEKPVALSLGEINEIKAKAAETGTIISIAHQRRYEPYYQCLKAIVASGKLGLPVRAEAQVGNDWDILSWTTHWFDTANYIYGKAPQYVLAGMDISDKRIYGHACENASIVFAEYTADQTATFVTGPQSHTNIRLVGPKGITIEQEGSVLVCTDQGTETIPYPEAPFNDAFAQLTSETLRALDGGPTPLCSLEACATATEMAYAAHESARTRHKVSLPLTTQFPPLEVLQHPAKSTLQGKRVLLYADHHFGSGGREGIADTLQTLTGIAPTVVDAATEALTNKCLENIDLVAIYHTQSDADLKTQEALTHWVQEKRPLCIIHAGLGAYRHWSDYQKWCGLSWDWESSSHPHDSSTLQATSGNPLNLINVESWLPKDEVFIDLKENSPITIGLTANLSNGASYPAAWTMDDYPNICAWMPGHRRDSWTTSAMQTGFTATLSAILQGN